MSACHTYWGSHGCGKPAGHVEEGDPIHVCGPSDDPEEVCSEHDGTRVRFMTFSSYDAADPGEWSEWMPGETFTADYGAR